MNSDQMLQASLKNNRALFIDTLKSLSLIDIGTIISIKDGRALVHGSSFTGGRQTVYQNAEVVFPGNNQGVYAASCAGSACLIFTPVSCMVDTETRVIDFTAAPYNSAGVKVLPIGNGNNNAITVQFEGDMYRIRTNAYSAVFKEDSLGIFCENTLSTLEIDEQGDIHVFRQGESSTYLQDITGEKAHTTYIQNGKQWDIEVSEGKLTLTQTANDQQTCEITIDEAGKVKIDAKEIDLNGDSKKFVTYSELDNALQDLLSSLKSHTHPVSTEGTAAAQTGTAAASLDLSSVTLDISDSATSTIKTGG